MWHLLVMMKRSLKNISKSSRVADENILRGGNRAELPTFNHNMDGRPRRWNGLSVLHSIVRAPLSYLSCFSHSHFNGADGVWVSGEFARASEINHLMVSDTLEQGRGDSTRMVNFPNEIIIDILSRLPAKSLLRLRCVSKTWCSIVRDPSIIKLHLRCGTKGNPALILNAYLHQSKLYYVEYELSGIHSEATKLEMDFNSSTGELELVGSCNGLLCLYDSTYPDPTPYLCNPATGEFKRLPQATIKCTENGAIFGFGFDSMNKEYVVVRVVTLWANYSSGNFQSEAEVYTQGFGFWRSIGDVPYLLHNQSSEAFVGGALHWITRRLISSDDSKRIVSFDTAKKTFREVPRPDFGFPFKAVVFHLGSTMGEEEKIDRCCYPIRHSFKRIKTF
ncbi:hypothetical protein HHK36_002203 [Tetracentron sinense]|uniref:F-box domain-containing protein n=1 Tax=Tetracentron sinense TaxID=13715 RepID=A0A834ZZF7_TETSI|nr:hypothetical protein HHK36_002203 [Tetracentron sinense]